MIIYKVLKDVTLTLANRKKIFIKDEEVQENIYTKAYPKSFSKIGITSGFSKHLSVPVFIPDHIDDFVTKENNRKEQKVIKEVESENYMNEFDIIEEPLEETKPLEEVETLEEVVETSDEILEDIKDEEHLVQIELEEEKK